MRGIRHYFRWAARPQLLVGFVIVCLCVGALGSVLRSTYASSNALRYGPQVKGAKEAFLPVPDCSLVPCMALTFDDGPDSLVTPRVLDILAREQIKATFFVVGQRVEGREHILKRIQVEGHEIGNHSWNHPSFTKLPPADMEMQLHKAQRAIMLAGAPAPYLFRPPYGAVDDAVMGHANMTVVRWNIDPADWEIKDGTKIKDHIMAHAKPGGIVLLHDVYSSTADALELTLPELKAHYQFVTAGQLLNVTPGDQGLYFGRQ